MDFNEHKWGWLVYEWKALKSNSHIINFIFTELLNLNHFVQIGQQRFLIEFLGENGIIN